MADKKFNLDFYAKVQTDVGSVKEVVKNLKAQLENLKLPAGATKNFERTFINLEKSIQEFESAASNGITGLADTKKIDNAWKKISGLFSTLGIQIKDLNSISDQVFPKEVSVNITKATKALGEYQAKIEAVKKSQGFMDKSKAKSEADTKVRTTTAEWQKAQETLEKKEREFAAKQSAWNQNRATQYETQKKEIEELNQQIDEQNAKLQEQEAIQKRLRSENVITKDGNIKDSHRRATASAEAEIAKLEQTQKIAKENLELAKQAEAQAKKTKTSAKGQETKVIKKVGEKDAKAVAATQARTAAEQAYAQAQAETIAKGQELATVEKQLKEARQGLAKLQNQSTLAEETAKNIWGIEDQIDSLEKSRDAMQKAAAANAEYKSKLDANEQALNDQRAVVQSYKQAMDDAKTAADSLDNEMNQMQLNAAKTEWEALIRVIEEFTGLDLSTTQGNIQEITRILEQYKADKIKEAPEIIEDLGKAAKQAEPQLDNTKKAVDEVTESITNMTRTERDIENLKDQVLDFFSISNTVQIFKDAVRSAIETVKELDAVMTETAVVTEFSVGDMWDKLPEYSDEANKLGTSIASLYEATTLYYQQGLKSQEAMDVGIETMKMARIANMDAAAATEAMTAALRGFNMEINETSATRINDVYSELAAITAADTSQIATAMSKTASIASSANMEFETTAALLAQIIETTQEAPETAGTAMKTIIARFTEVKQLFDEGMLTGKDSEGEEININKIDAALKKVGISLSDFLRGEKGIDDIFLELASKWDSLDLATQRYIATTAAGSRQQSRFLAMMGNYERTMELVTAANNSAGASQKQFDKTLESLEAKLQRLKNAWAEFTMGLANNEVIKGSVDLITGLLEGINNLTDVGSDGLGGLMTTLLRLGTVIMGLKGGKAIIEGLLKTFVSGKTTFGKQMLEGLGGMGLGKALATKGWIKIGVLDALSEQGAQAEEVLDNVKAGFLKAGDGAKLFGKKLLALSPYIAILIAIGAAVYGIVKSFKAAQNEAKLDNINQALEDLNTEAQNAQDELGEIGSARTELKGLQDTLNDLTKGTTEWKSALVDVNHQVLELIEKYPSLEYELGANGALQITEESWDNLLAQQQQVITNMTAQRLDLESQRANIVKDIGFEKFIVDSYGADTAGQSASEKKRAQASIDFAQWQQNSPLLAILEDFFVGANGGSYDSFKHGSAQNRRERLLAEDENYYVNEVVKNLTKLENQDEIIALAAEFAREGENSQTVDQGKFIEMLETATDREWTDDAAEKLLNSIKEFDKATNSFNDLIQTEIENQSSQESLTRQFTMNALTESSIMEKDYADSIVNIISKGEKEAISAQVNAKASELEASYKDEEGNWKNLEELAAEYARINGFQAVGQEVYRDGTYSEKLDTSPEAMIRALATEAITVEVKEKAEKTAGAIGKEKEQEKLFDNLFSTDGQEITGAQQSKYYNADTGIIDYESIAKDMGYEAEGFLNAAQVMAKELKLMPSDLKKILDDNFKNAAERSKKQRLATASSIAEYSTGSGLTRDEIYASVAEAEKQMQGELTDIEVRGILDSAIQALSSTGDSQLAQTSIFKLLSEGVEGNAEKFKALSDVITGINWNDPVEASSQIQKHLNSSNTTAKEFAQEMMALNSTFLGDASQLQAFFNSSEYEEIAGKITEIREAQEKVTGADVDELASEYSYLNKMLKNTKMTSEGLAAILNQVSEGALGFEEINDVILAGIKNLGSFGASLDKILAYLNDFDPGRDEGQAQDFIDQASEVVNERVSNFEYGNTEARNYITELLGKDYLQGDAQQQMAAMDAAAKWLQEISGAPGAAMQVFKNMAEGKDIMGNTITGGQQKPEGINFGYGTDGKFFMDIDAQKYGTLEEVTAALGKSNLGGTKTMWDTMLTLMSNYDPTFMQEWEMEQAALAPQRMREEALKIDGKVIISQKTIDATAQAMYEALGDSTGKSFEDFQKEIVDGLNELGDYEFFDVFNVDGTRKELEQLKKDIENLFGGGEKGQAGLLSNYLIGEDGKQLIDFTSLTKGLETFGLTTQEAFSAALDYVSELPAQLESVKSIMVNGQEISLVNADGTKKDLEVVKEEIINVKTATEEGNTEIQVNTATATQKVRNYIATLNSIPRKIVTNVHTNETSSTSSSGPSGGGRIGGPVLAEHTMLSEGTENHPKSELSLTGEEGPELVESKDGAYLVGIEGPQMAYINRGDTVHTAEETEEIYRRKGQKVESYAKGKDGTTTGILDLDKIISGSSGGRSGGSSSDDEEETWENPFDKLYNLLRKIDEELHQRERIERRYEKLLEGIDASAAKIIAVSREELGHLEQERKLQEYKISGRNYQIDEYQKENSDLQKYARFVEDDRGERVLRIDWDLIDRVTDTEKGERIEEYVSQLEEWDDDLQEAEEALWEIEDTIAEIKERGKDQYEELEETIKDAVTQAYQDQIDKLSQINESINDTNTELLDAIQNSIDKQRQDRDNKRTEDEIAEKQRRLLYLQQDTSGANALEILKLQDEITQGQEDYTDTLIDQKISELQRQNDEAAKQREKQITLLQAQLDHYIEFGAIWDEVYTLMENGLDENNGLIRGSRLETILKNSENFSGLSAIGQQEWWKEMNTMIAEALAYLELGRQLEDIGVKNQEIEIVLPSGQTIKGTVDDQGNVTGENGQIYNNVWQGIDGRYYAGENTQEPEEPTVEHPNDGTTPPASETEQTPKTTTIKKNIKNGFNVRRGASMSASKIGALPKGTEIEIDGYKGEWYHIISPWEGFIHTNAVTSSVDRSKLKAYKTGGLADFTGPAWLDGTKSRPEIVLNQQDSRNFIQLRDILSAVLNRGNVNTSTENNGDILYDIDINVESIGNDYDVEQVANKVKSLINEDARYRNNNMVSLKR